MNKAIKKTTIGMLVIVFGFLTVLTMFGQTSISATGGSDLVLQDDGEITGYLRAQYTGNKRYVSKSQVKRYDLDTKNFAQNSFNNYYNNLHVTSGDNISGTCSVIATTSIIEYYERIKADINTGDTDLNNFVLIMNQGLINEHTTRTEGTSGGTIDNLLEDAFAIYGSPNRADNDYMGLYDKVVSETDAGRPVIFSIPGHSMVGAGYITYKVTYSYRTLTQRWENRTEVKRFIICNDGWSTASNGSDQYSYYPEEAITPYPTSLNTRVVEK